MTEAFETLVAVAWFVGLAVAAVLLARVTLRRWFGSAVVYGLWSLPVVAATAVVFLPRPDRPRIISVKRPSRRLRVSIHLPIPV